MPFENPTQNPFTASGDTSAGAFETWLIELRQAFQVQQWFITAMGGAADGVWAHTEDADDIGKVKANTVPNMTVKIRPFAGFVANVPFRIPDQLITSALTAPSTSPRIDTVVARALPGLAGEFVILTGIEDASPTAPSAGSNDILLAWIHHRVGETSIKDTDDATNGYIEDKRTFTNI